MNKEEYKIALEKILNDIQENLDNIIEYGFSKSTSSININIKVEPDCLLTWDCYYKHIVHEVFKGDNNE